MSKISPPRVVIVDGTHPTLLRDLLENNVECLRLQSRPEPAAFDARPYDGDLGFAGDVTDAIHLLAEFAPTAVVAGSREATGFAEAVADGLCLPTHAIERHGARRYVEGLLRAARPGAGAIIAQPAEFAGAPQLLVNTVSDAGAHGVTDVWRLLDVRDDGAFGPGMLQLCDPAAADVAPALAGARRILDDLGFRFGPAHAQFALTGDGPRLVGAAACLMEFPAAADAYAVAGLQPQARIWAERLAGSGLARLPEDFRPVRSTALLLFRFAQRARIARLDGLDRLGSLPSFQALESPLPRGAIVEPRSTWLGQGGVVHLVHDDPAQISADARQFRAWEAQSQLYGLAPIAKKEGA
jgi:hypothetical protein